MRRLTDHDTQIGKWFTYGKVPGHHHRVRYTTYYDEDYPNEKHNAIVGSLFGWGFRLLLPQLINPVAVKVAASHWPPETIARIGRDYYYSYFNREWGFTIHENYFQLMWGVQGASEWNFPSMLMKEKSWSCLIPWLSYRPTAHQVFDGDGQLVWEEQFQNTQQAKENNAKRFDLTQQLTHRQYLVEDSDGEEIVVRVHQEFRKWERGTSWCSWLSWFMKGIKHRTIELEFTKEIGQRKGSWKGGLIATGYKMLPNETIDVCVERFFKEKSKTDDRDLKGVTLIKRIV